MRNHMNNLQEKVEKAIEQLRPYLNNDGGDMELVEITNDNIVKVRLIGACQTCSMSPMTLKAGLEEALKQTSPEVNGVVAVEY